VVARSHPKWGERPIAFVILRPEHAKTWTEKHDHFAKELKEHGRKTLPGFACPEWVQVVEELPVSTVSYHELT
jgi:acyl-coenzyme A synthetase/AMP-(fatty) acid ligase